MSKRKRKHPKQPIGLYIAIIIVFVLIALLEAYLRKPREEEYTYSENHISEDAAVNSDYVILPKNLEVPICGANWHEEDHEIRRFKYYTICYRESCEQAEWSAYCLTSELLAKKADRTNDFRPDNLISTQSASLADYKGSGYDRGHLTPAADMAFDQQAMSETFYMSNMSPQVPDFNRGIWMYLESQVREWTKSFGRVYVVSGPLLNKKSQAYDSIGQNRVAVPEAFYKVVLVPLYENELDRESSDDTKSVMSIGFIIPNKKCTNSFWDYAVSVDEVEEVTGLDFYSMLDDKLENRVEAEVDIRKW